MTDLDPMLREAMSRVPRPSNARPSITDVRRRARRRNRRRMAATAGALACTGVATTALIVRRDASEQSASGTAETVDTAPAGVDAGGTTTVFIPPPTTLYTLIEMTVTPANVWDALSAAHFDPSGAAVAIAPADDAAAAAMPTPEQFGCNAAECTVMFNYVVWHELALQLGFTDVREMQASNPSVDFSQPPHEGDHLQSVSPGAVVTPQPGSNDETPTTISVFDGIILIDGGAPAGAMDDLYQRLAGYNRVIVPSSGKRAEQTMVMPIDGTDAMATAVGGLLGLDGLDAWDPAFLGDPIRGMVAVVVGPNYFDRATAVTTTAVVTTTSIG